MDNLHNTGGLLHRNGFVPHLRLQTSVPGGWAAPRATPGPRPLPQVTSSVVVEGDQQAGSRRGGFCGSGPGGDAHYTCCFCSVTWPQLRVQEGGEVWPCCAPRRKQKQIWGPASNLSAQCGFGSPTIPFTLPDILKPYPLRAVTAKGRVSGRWRPTCWVQTCS